MKSLVERFELTKKTWELLLEGIPFPPQDTVIIWLNNFQDHLIERAFVNVRKYRRQQVEPERVYRAVSAELKHLEQYWKPKPNVSLPPPNAPLTPSRSMVKGIGLADSLTVSQRQRLAERIEAENVDESNCFQVARLVEQVKQGLKA